MAATSDSLVMVAPDGTQKTVPTWQRKHWESLGATVAPDASTSPIERKAVDAEVASPEYQRRIRGQNRSSLASALPAAGGLGFAALASALVGPEAALPARMAGAGLGGLVGGMVGEGGREMVAPEPMTPADRLKALMFQGGANGLGALLGEGGAGLVGGASKMLMRDALAPSPTVQRAAMGVARRQAGKFVNPEDAGVWNQALEHRIAPGKGVGGKVGSEEAQKLSRPLIADKQSALTEAAQAGHGFNIFDATQNIGDLRKELFPQANPRLEAALDRRVQEIVDQFSTTTRKGGRKLNRLTPEQFDKLKTDWQSEADAVFRAQDKRQYVPARAQFEARLKANLASSVRRALEGLPNGIGDRLAKANAGLAKLYPLEEAMTNAEMRNPTSHGLMDRLLRPVTSPAVLGRTALALHSPPAYFLGRGLPFAASAAIPSALQVRTPEQQGESVPPFMLGKIP